MLFEPKKLFFDEILPFFFFCQFRQCHRLQYGNNTIMVLLLFKQKSVADICENANSAFENAVDRLLPDRIQSQHSLRKKQIIALFFSLWKHRTKICFKLSKRDCIEYFNSNLRFLYLGQHEFNKHLMRLVTVSFGKFT